MVFKRNLTSLSGPSSYEKGALVKGPTERRERSTVRGVDLDCLVCFRRIAAFRGEAPGPHRIINAPPNEVRRRSLSCLQ